MLHLRTTTRAAAMLLSACLTAAPALAQPVGLSVRNIVTGHYGSLDVKTESNKVGHWGMILKTKDDTDLGTDEITLAGGGFTGWHTHPAAVFVTVISGSIVWYDGTNAMCPPTTYSANQSFIEDAFVIHNATNASQSNPAVFVAMHVNPTGVPFVVGQPKPGTCH
ncbi:MAG: cupin domain-containing protein [Sphingomicrobium sp.]